MNQLQVDYHPKKIFIENQHSSDVNVHKINLFLRPNFQFVSISKQNETFYAYFTVIERKIKSASFKYRKKKTKLEGNKTYFGINVLKQIVFDTKLTETLTFQETKINFCHDNPFQIDFKRRKKYCSSFAVRKGKQNS
jgi:hypothetical protein